MAGVGLNTLLIRCSNPATWRSRLFDLLEELPGGIGGVGREPLAALAQQRAPAHAEEIRPPPGVEGVLGQGGGEPILELGALTDERHPRPRQLALVPQLAGRNPHRGQRPIALQRVEPRGGGLIRLVYLAHHQLRLARVHELGDTAGPLDLVDDPVPVADRLQRDRGARLTAPETAGARPAHGPAVVRGPADRPPGPPRPGCNACGHRTRYIPSAASPLPADTAECFTHAHGKTAVRGGAALSCHQTSIRRESG